MNLWRTFKHIVVDRDFYFFPAHLQQSWALVGDNELSPEVQFIHGKSVISILRDGVCYIPFLLIFRLFFLFDLDLALLTLHILSSLKFRIFLAYFLLLRIAVSVSGSSTVSSFAAAS